MTNLTLNRPTASRFTTEYLTLSALVQKYFQGWTLTVDHEVVSIDDLGNLHCKGDYNHYAVEMLEAWDGEFQTCIYDRSKSIEIITF